MLVQRRVGMGTELGDEVPLLLRRNPARAPWQRLRGQVIRRGQLVEVAIDGADADAKHAGRVRLADAGLDRLHEVGAQIKGVGTHGQYLRYPSIMPLGQRLRNLL